MIPEKFFTFIGAIDATIFYIATQRVQGPFHIPQPEQAGANHPLETLLDEGVALRDLKNVRDSLLLAEAKLSNALGPHLVFTPAQFPNIPLVPPVPPSKLQVAAAWKDFYDAVQGETSKFLKAVNALMQSAPEWSRMDEHLRLLMEASLAAAASKLGGGGSGDPAGSWDNTFSSSSSSSSSPP